MTTIVEGGIAGFAAEEDAAANDDRAEATGKWKVPHIDKRAGWDPYEVWRTRVKKARDTSGEPDETGH